MSKTTHKPTLENNGYEYIDTEEPLKTCPFCGGESRARISRFGYGQLGVTIQCSKCCARSFPMLYNCGIHTADGWKPETVETAIARSVKYWNRRKVGAAL